HVALPICPSERLAPRRRRSGRLRRVRHDRSKHPVSAEPDRSSDRGGGAQQRSMAADQREARRDRGGCGCGAARWLHRSRHSGWLIFHVPTPFNLPIVVTAFVATPVPAALKTPRSNVITQLLNRRCAQAPSMPEGRAERAVGAGECWRRALTAPSTAAS